MYKPLVIDNRKVNVLTHECSTKKEIPLCSIDAQGIVSFSANFSPYNYAIQAHNYFLAAIVNQLLLPWLKHDSGQLVHVFRN